jgi:CRP/FNR family cyclic AMP-dependent transcriptional regulator
LKIASIRLGGKSKKVASATTAPRFDSKPFLISVGIGRSGVKYRPKETVFRQGAAADAVYYIQKGKIQLTVVSEHGREAIIARLGAGEFFGEGCLAGQTLYMASAVATAESIVARIEMETMIRVLHEQPDLSETFMSFLLSRNIQIEADLVDQLFNSSEQRLARVLLLLANFGKKAKMETVIPKISQETLAAKVGTTRARIKFFMNKFRKLGFIEYDNGLQINIGGLKVHTSLLDVIVQD